MMPVLSIIFSPFWLTVIIIYLIFGLIFIILLFAPYKNSTVLDTLMDFLGDKEKEWAKRIDVSLFTKYLMRSIFISFQVILLLLPLINIFSIIIYAIPTNIWAIINKTKQKRRDEKLKKFYEIEGNFTREMIYNDDEETKAKHKIILQELIATNKKKHQIFYHEHYCSFFIKQVTDEIFKPYQIFYIEDTYNPVYNNYIEKYYNEIQEICKSFFTSESEFIYFPKQTQQFSDHNFLDALNYYMPFESYNKENLFEVAKKANTSIISKIILKNLFGYEYPVRTGFFVYITPPIDDIKYHRFEYYYMPEFITDEKMFINYIKFLFSQFRYRSQSKVCYRLSDINDLADYEKKFDLMAHKVAEELKQQLLFLKNGGYNLFLLKLFQNINADHEKINFIFDSTAQTHDLSTLTDDKFLLSKIIITKDYKILLPDYSNMEIEMTPLPKAVYILFLRHPEGILLKYLDDYKEELLHIYKHLSYRESPEEMAKSINELVDPTKNSINEKCSRIKEAFLKKMDDSMAKYYYITGERGKEKSIKLQEHLIIMEAKFEFLNSNMQITNYQKIQNKEKQVESLLEQLKENINKKNYYDAIHNATLILQLNSFHLEALQHRAQAYFETAEYRKAIDDDLASLNIKHDLAIAYFNLAEAYYIIKDFTLALEKINFFIKEYNNDHSEGYYLRGLIYEATNNMKKALMDWVKAKEQGHKKASEKINSYLEKRKKKNKIQL